MYSIALFWSNFFFQDGYFLVCAVICLLNAGTLPFLRQPLHAVLPLNLYWPTDLSRANCVMPREGGGEGGKREKQVRNIIGVAFSWRIFFIFCSWFEAWVSLTCRWLRRTGAAGGCSWVGGPRRGGSWRSAGRSAGGGPLLPVLQVLQHDGQQRWPRSWIIIIEMCSYLCTILV